VLFIQDLDSALCTVLFVSTAHIHNPQKGMNSNGRWNWFWIALPFVLLSSSSSSAKYFTEANLRGLSGGDGDFDVQGQQGGANIQTDAVPDGFTKYGYGEVLGENRTTTATSGDESDPTTTPTSGDETVPATTTAGQTCDANGFSQFPFLGHDNPERMLLREGIINSIPSRKCGRSRSKNVILVIGDGMGWEMIRAGAVARQVIDELEQLGCDTKVGCPNNWNATLAFAGRTLSDYYTEGRGSGLSFQGLRGYSLVTHIDYSNRKTKSRRSPGART
jgi:hypothetical protein